MSVDCWIVDSFTGEPFAGNPAGVCLLPRAAEAEWMQRVAREFNLSETAFLTAEDGAYRLRWFTPEVEVELCGHATLASAHVLWTEGLVDREKPIRFLTKSGPLTAHARGGLIELDFPSRRAQPVVPPWDLARALGAVPRWVGRNEEDLLVLLENERAVVGLDPDIPALNRLGPRGVIVTAAAETPEHDFVSRFFAPAVGIPEDPVTGSAHCCLAPFWADRLGRERMSGYQASSRGGTVRVRVDGGRVTLGGAAVTVLRGSLTA